MEQFPNNASYFCGLQISESQEKHHHVEYYDIRAAEAALSALNMSDIAGKQIKVESSQSGGTRRYSQFT